MYWTVFIFLWCFLGSGDSSNISSLRSKRAVKSSKLLGLSSYSLCETPSAPRNGLLSCSTSYGRMTCTATCITGYQFTDKSTKQVHSCALYDGIWSPEARFRNCEPVCEQPCENGGHCFGNNRCVCAPNFRGDRCQFPLSNCDGSKFLRGSWSCNHTSIETQCTIACPPGMQFEYLPASVYSCDLEGNWTPQKAPTCQSVNVIVHRPPQPSLEPITVANANPSMAYSVINGGEKNGICSTWNQLHYRTFGGSMFSFEGKCTYLLSRDCASETFGVFVVSDPFCNGVYNCKRSVIIDAYNRRYTLKNDDLGPGIFSDGERLKIPCTVGGLLVETIGNHIVVESGLGFKVRWNGNDGVSVEVQKELQNSTCGICGRIEPSGLVRDLQLVDGSITTSIVTFANSWKISDITDYCPDVTRFDHHCKYDRPENQKIFDKSNEVCGRLLNTEYGACHAVLDVQPYFDMCRMDFCGCGEGDNNKCICSTVSAYFQQCFRLGVKLTRSWRKDDFCSAKCPEGLIYSDCGSGCPPTCKKGAQECSSDSCVEGCFCPPGTFLHEEKCIQKEQCPCYHNGKAYSRGDRIFQDCNACICEQSNWECTDEVCEGRCSAVGDPHYTTFDGRHYDFMGKCSYYLLYNNDYSIEQENVACSGAISEKMGFSISPNNKYPSCTKSVIIRIKGTVVHLKQRLEVSINGNDIYDLPVSAPGVYVYIASSLYLKAKLDNGLVVTWDGISRVYIDAPPSFIDKTSGLCGTFNHNQKDEYLTTSGDVEQDVYAFANKWKTSDSCRDTTSERLIRNPCEMFSDTRIVAQTWCDKLKGSGFSGCHDVVDYEPFYQDCMYDMCFCQTKLENCLCPILADYGVACSKRQAQVSWRKQVQECGISCPSEQTYQVCGSSCKRSCIDISYHTNCREECIEGCNCPPGTTLNRVGECIAISDCPCVHGGKNFNPGHLDVRGNMTCECKDALWNCRPALPKELEEYRLEKLIDKPICSAAANLEYTDCAPDCTKTCKNMHSPPSCLSKICKPGCSCKKGYVLDTKSERCVLESECPCHHGGQSYGEGETIKDECKTCVCDGGIWNCEKKDCPEICEAWGASHFKTFDGRQFEFHGDCDYILAKGGLEVYDRFSIIIRNVVCGSSDVTCSKSVIFQIGDEKVTLTSERQITNMNYGSRYIMREVGLFVFIHTDIGITLQWDKGTRIYVRAETRWKNAVEGLCGNFNNDESDDFKTPDGGLTVVKASTFGDSWRLRDYCPVSKIVNDTCELNPNRKTWALKQCSLLKSTLFRRCHSEVPVEPYLERCTFDTCGCDMGGDCECLCTALAAYAQECSNNGVVIKWRSQSLCPIQCEECAQYTGCMPVCPKPTCETEVLYEGIEKWCENEACVEGCEPKPCPPGQKYNNPREWKCIPESDCLVEIKKICKVISGITYYEGQRINDPKFSDDCQSCFCRRGNVVCVGQRCLTTTPPPITTTTTPMGPTRTTITSPTTPEPTQIPGTTPVGCVPGWTEWMNGFMPTFKNGGDYETLDLLRKRDYRFCDLKNMTHIECRTATTHTHYKESGQNVWCALPKGLTCLNKDQPSVKLCQDFEIRVFCQCEITPTPTTTTSTTTAPTTITPTTTTPTITTTPYPEICIETGWTTWMNSRESNGDGDFEIIPELRKKFSFCGVKNIDNVECRPFNSLQLAPQDLPNVECTKDRGLVCRNTPNYYCSDYEVRFHCECQKGCPMPLGIESKAISDQQISVSSYRNPAKLGHYGRLNGQSSWSAGNIEEPQWIEVNLGERKNVSQIVTQGDPLNYEWVSLYTILFSDDGNTWDEIISEGKEKKFIGNSENLEKVVNELDTPIVAQFIRLVPLDWNEWISLRMELLGCDLPVEVATTTTTIATTTTKATTTTITTTTAETTTTIRGTTFPHLCTPGWTVWMNIDNPTSVQPYEIASGSIGDLELADEHRYFYSFCTYPTTVECRVAGTEKMAHLTGEEAVCNVDGLFCSNEKQQSGTCSDYEVRYFCECETTIPTSPTEATTTTITSTKPPCSEGWTEWMDSAKPQDSSVGDIESYSSLRSKFSFCEDDAIKAIECRVSGTNVSYEEAGQLGVSCDINKGLLCEHALQRRGICKDFEVRLYCVCGPTTTSTPSTESTVAVTPETTTGGPPQECKVGWTDWYNMDTPDDDGVDSELLQNIPNFKTICVKPIKVECQNANTLTNYNVLGQQFKIPCNETGIVCENQQQQSCDDYEIRVYCLCQPEPPTTPSYCEHGWTPWYNIDSPDTGEGDFELVDDIRSKHNICAEEFVKDIQCEARRLSIASSKSSKKKIGGSSVKTLGTKTRGKGGYESPSSSKMTSVGYLDYSETGDHAVKCIEHKGLVCYNSQQGKRKCRDYRVRFFCDCGVTSTPIVLPTPSMPPTRYVPPREPICGWTEWMNSDHPSERESGDYETINRLQEFYRMCRTEDIADIECRIAESKVPWKVSGQTGLVCNIPQGFRCEDRYQNKGCYDYEVRVLCNPPGCPPLTAETTTTSTIATTTTPPCLPGKVWTDCAYYCNGMCQSFLHRYSVSQICTDNDTCVPGCISEECVAPYVWRDEDTCVKPEECTCYTRGGKLLAPGEIFESDCLECQCVGNELNCVEIPNCSYTMTVTEPGPTVTETEITPTTTTESECADGYTDWFNMHTLDANGEVENAEAVRNAGIKFCDDKYISEIECREIGTEVPFYDTDDQGITCNVIEGLSCENRRQPNRGICSDYEIRFLCQCAEIVTTTEAPSCNYWSDWINEDNPLIGIGDVERLNPKSTFCNEGIVEAIECVLAKSETPASKDEGRHLTCSVADGFKCLNKYQPDRVCADYKIRYFCGCEEKRPLCPHVTKEMSKKCPSSCPDNYFCDGRGCVTAANCPCHHEGHFYKVGELMHKQNCEECICKLGGQLYCYNKTCDMCPYGREGVQNEKCVCECKTCPESEILCPSDLQCIKREQWCDGKVDCPDDEVDCTTTTSTTTTTLPTTTSTQCPPTIIPACHRGEVILISDPNDPCPRYDCVIPPTPTPAPQTNEYSCTMLSNVFSTFDGYQYSYDLCQHVLMQDKASNRFNVTVHKNCEGKDKSCPRYLVVSQGKHRIKVVDHKVEFDGIFYGPSQLILLGKKIPDLSAKHVGDKIIIHSTKFNFRVTWDKSTNAIIEVNDDVKDAISGLCGYFNGNPNDDKLTPNGEEVDSAVDFGDSWSLGSLDECSPVTCPAHIMTEAEASCNQLRFQPFDVCNNIVDPTHYISACKSSICECMLKANSSLKDCQCKAYLPYVEACEMKQVIKLRYWRVKQSCLPDCPMGLVWKDCGSTCERTCENMAELREANFTCSNDRCVSGCFCPDGLVRKGDHCVKPEKCEDCVCKGYGDPHYWTFDGSYFPFQGNCTYILSRDVLPRDATNVSHKFEVYATNEDCLEEPLTTCTVAVMVLYNGHIAHFKVNESVTFDKVQLIPSDFPFHEFGIHIESIPGRSVTISVPEVHLVVRYFELNYGFEVRVPSEVYYNKTEGLCGNCNFNDSDDFRTQDGSLLNDSSEFSFAWIAKPPKQFESVNEICRLPPPPPPCYETIEVEMCKRLLQDPFTSCHALIDPESYVRTCRYDICHSVSSMHSLCRAATEYARKCAEVGICIDNWRTPEFCPYQCPPEMHYEQCGSTCPKSCKDIVVEDWIPHGRDIADFDLDEFSLEQTLQELVDVCDSTPVDGCFCHSSKVLKDGQCVDPIFCKSCDDDGHKPGDTWQVDSCTSCKCTMKLSVECLKTACPVPPICTSDEHLNTTRADNLTCCDTYECVKIRPICPVEQPKPVCRQGEVLKTRANSDNCPEYYCECEVLQCPAATSPLNLAVGEETRVVTRGCCPIIEIVCNTSKCPLKPVCPQYHELKERKSSELKCCPEFYCEPPPNVCLYSHEFEVVNGLERKYNHELSHQKIYKAGEIWVDGLCRNCTCESGYGQSKQKCVVEICSQLDTREDKEDYVWETKILPNVCCPQFVKQSCIHQGKEYPINAEWASDESNCKRYRCGKLANGEVVKIERSITCNKNCNDGFEYLEPPEDSSECCGKCQQVACEEDGTWHKVGAVWNSTARKCYTVECSATNDALQMQYSMNQCPPIAMGCVEKVLDSDGCCEVCVKTTPAPPRLNCAPQKVKEENTVEMFEHNNNRARCTNRYPITDMMECDGNCPSKSVYSPDTSDFVTTCSCCKPSQVERRKILLNCTDGVHRPFHYSHVVDCLCAEEKCEPSKKGSLNMDYNQIAYNDF